MKQLITGILLITLLNSCKKEEKILPSDVITNTPASTGSVVGFARLRDESGTLVADAGDVTVSLIGTSISATTTVTGKYVLSDIPVGTYNLKLSKLGYDYSIQQVYITGNGTATILPQDLYQLPTQEIGLLSYAGYDSTGYNFKVTLALPTALTTVSIVIAYSTIPGVNITDSKKKIQYVDEIKFPRTSFLAQTTTITLPRSFFRPKYPNAVLYLKAFASNSRATILDTGTGLFYYSNYTTPAPEVSFKVL